LLGPKLAHEFVGRVNTHAVRPCKAWCARRADALGKGTEAARLQVQAVVLVGRLRHDDVVRRLRHRLAESHHRVGDANLRAAHEVLLRTTGRARRVSRKARRCQCEPCAAGCSRPRKATKLPHGVLLSGAMAHHASARSHSHSIFCTTALLHALHSCMHSKLTPHSRPPHAPLPCSSTCWPARRARVSWAKAIRLHPNPVTI